MTTKTTKKTKKKRMLDPSSANYKLAQAAYATMGGDMNTTSWTDQIDPITGRPVPLMGISVDGRYAGGNMGLDIGQKVPEVLASTQSSGAPIRGSGGQDQVYAGQAGNQAAQEQRFQESLERAREIARRRRQQRTRDANAKYDAWRAKNPNPLRYKRVNGQYVPIDTTLGSSRPFGRR